MGLVIPTLDTELATLASVRDEWARWGVHSSVSDPDLIAQCRDKRLTAHLFASLGVSPLREVSDEFPRFIKPVSGSLSSDIHLIRHQDDLHPRLEDRTRFIHQELIDSAELLRVHGRRPIFESGGSGLCGATPSHRSPRWRDLEGTNQKGPMLQAFRELLTSIPRARGCLTIQLFHSTDREDRPLIGIEVNARFGGGFPMSHAAGATLAKWLADETFVGQQLTYREDWKGGLTFLRYDDQVAVDV